MHSLCCRRIQPDRVFPPSPVRVTFCIAPFAKEQPASPHSRHRQQELLVLVAAALRRCGAAALHDGDIRVWDSLAICEYLHERSRAFS